MQTVRYRDKQQLIEAVVRPEDTLLDVGFWGQGIAHTDADWPHKKLVERASRVDGVDLELNQAVLATINPKGTYLQGSAEDFDMQERYTKILALDIIEHLPNPGLFLDQCKAHLADGGVLVLSTPNAFNLFNLAGKLTRFEPVVNKDHTCYFNTRTLECLLRKCGWEVVSNGFLHTLGVKHVESGKKKMLNVLYAFASRFTNKYMETMVYVVRPADV